ncbi:hypothetical protein ACQP2X_11600 [Actinoplanes sp. CA-131856]
MRGRDEADRVAGGGRTGDPGLDRLLDAARAPATPAETRGGEQMAAALAAERRRALAAQKRPARPRPARPRAVIVGVATAVFVLGAGGTAVAARTGSLPVGAQQQAHRLFSGLGVPPPIRTTPPAGPPTPTAATLSRPPSAPTPRPSASTPQSSASTSQPAPSGSSPAPSSPPPAPSATASTSAAAAEDRIAWCTAWQIDADGGHPMNGRDRRDLFAAAGGEENVADYCDGVAAPSPSPGKKK